MIDMLKRIEEALDPYAPYVLIAMFLWLGGGCLYQALSWAGKRVTARARGRLGPWGSSKAVLVALLDRFRRGLR